VTEKSFDEFHLYTLARQTTLRDRETKQVEFARAESVKAPSIYVYDGAEAGYRFLRQDATTIPATAPNPTRRFG
jgi:hypothetical protein